jgi:RimJ/RimL family protein N-acetyltransferase
LNPPEITYLSSKRTDQYDKKYLNPIMSHIELIAKARALRTDRKQEAAFELLSANLDSAKYQNLLFENHPIWWSEIKAGICQLTRRSSKDIDFVRKIWKQKDFIYSFHRHANSLPNENEKLAQLLDKEYLALVSESHAVHWIVKDRTGKPWGLLSINGISLTHKRAEVLLGVADGAPRGLSTAAMLMLFQFYFKAIKFNKLLSFVYEDNPHSLKGTLHIGFKEEGRFKKHVIDPRSNQYVNLIQTGLLAEDAFSEKNKRLMQRLLS